MQAFINFATSVNCPPAYELLPCTCDIRDSAGQKLEGSIAVTCSDPRTTLEQLKNAIHSLKDYHAIQVHMKNLTLGTIPSDFFSGVKISHMFISSSNIHSFSGGGGLPLKGLEKTLQILNIVGSITIKNASKELPVGHLKNLRHLDLVDNEITELSNEWFEISHKSLYTLGFYGNDIEFIGDRAFSYISNLEELYLTDNRFGPIARSMFPNPANMLHRLDLSNNALTSLPENIFSNMPKLIDINLRSNGLTYLPENTWRNFWTKVDGITIITISENPLICNSRMDWISQTPTCVALDGQCAHPRKKRGEQIPVVYRESCFDDKPKDDIEELKSCVDYCFEKHQNKSLLL